LRELEGTFDTLYGLEIVSCGDEEARGRVEVRPELKQAEGALHGGVLAAMAEGLTATATSAAVADDGNAATALSNTTSLLRPVTEGTVHALARRRHRGRTTWVWEVDFLDDANALVGTGRVTVEVFRR